MLGTASLDQPQTAARRLEGMGELDARQQQQRAQQTCAAIGRLVVRGHLQAQAAAKRQAPRKAVPEPAADQRRGCGEAHEREEADREQRQEAELHADDQDHHQRAAEAREDRRQREQRAEILEPVDEAGQQLQEGRVIQQPVRPGPAVAVEIQRVPDGRRIWPPFAAALEQRREEVDGQHLQHERGRGEADMPVVGRRRDARSRRVDAEACGRRQEQAPEQQAAEQIVAAEQDQRIARAQRGRQHEADEGGEARAPADHQRESRQRADAEQQRLPPGVTAREVQREAPGAGQIGQPAARQHAGIGIERAQIEAAVNAVAEQHGAEHGAEQRERAQVDAKHKAQSRADEARKICDHGRVHAPETSRGAEAPLRMQDRAVQRGWRSPMWPVPPSSHCWWLWPS